MRDGFYRAATPPLVEQPPVTYRPEVRTTLGQSLFLTVGRPLWGLRVELALLGALAGVGGLVWWQAGRWWALAVVSGLVAAGVGVRPVRGWLGRVLHAASVRRRWALACRYAGLATWNDRVPAIWRHHRVPAGDRLDVRVPAGSNVPALVDAAETIAAFLAVREVRIRRDPGNAQRAEVVIVRRDPLAGEPVAWPWRGLAGPCDLWRPFPVGVDDDGSPVLIGLPERSVLLGGEPGAGKSVALSLLLAVAALDPRVRLYLLDGKLVELADWAGCAERFAGPDVGEAIGLLAELRREMDARYRCLRDAKAKKVAPGGLPLVVVAIDELAFYLNAPDRKASQEFAGLLRDLLQRGRAAGIIVLAATQKPSHDIVPTSIRDLFSSRWALRCTTPQASDTILGQGWAAAGYSAATIDAANRGVGWLWHEGAEPIRLRTYFLTGEDLARLGRLAEHVRGVTGSRDRHGHKTRELPPPEQGGWVEGCDPRGAA